MNKKTLTLAALATLTAALAGGAALAGRNETWNVYVDTTGRYVSGSLGTARPAADHQQMMECWTYSTSTSAPYASCYAVDATGKVGNCYSFNASLIDAVNGLPTDAYVAYGYDANGQCTSITAMRGSRFAPKAL